MLDLSDWCVPSTSRQLPQIHYAPIDSLKDIPRLVWKFLDAEGGIAGPGEPIDLTDFVHGHARWRFVLGGVASSFVLLLWEEDGIALRRQIAILQFDQAEVRMRFLGSGPADARSLADVLRYLEERSVENVMRKYRY